MPKRVDDGVNIPNQIVNRILAKVRGKQENKKCFDCPEKNPQWASVTFGVLLCTNCSGRHRRMGTHISFVRSTTMDGWTVAQLKRMFAGGNMNATEHFSKHGIQLSAVQSRTIENKYCCKPARLYVTSLEQKIKKYQLDDDTTATIEKYVAEKKRAHKKKHRHGHHHHDTDSGTSSSDDDDTAAHKGSSLISSAKKEEIHQFHEKAANKDHIYESHIISKPTHHHHLSHSHDKNKKKKKKNPFLDDDDLDDLEDFDDDKNGASKKGSGANASASSTSKTVSADIDDFDFDDLEVQIEKDKQQRVQIKAKQEEERRQREELQLQKDRDRELKRKDKEKRRAEKYKDGSKDSKEAAGGKYGKKKNEKVYSMQKIADLNEVKKTQAMGNDDPFASLDDLANAIKKEQSEKHKFLYNSNRSGF